MEICARTIEELENEAALFVERLSPHKEHATLVTLSGELGAGKTAFAKAVAKTLGIHDTVTSPTFVLEKIYLVPELGSPTSKFKRLVHIDAYRLKSGTDLAPLGFDEIMNDPCNLVLFEWPEMVADVFLKPSAKIVLTTQPDGSRRITYD